MAAGVHTSAREQSGVSRNKNVALGWVAGLDTPVIGARTPIEASRS